MRNYSNKDIKYLTEKYPTEDKGVIMGELMRSWNSIQKKAFKLGISRVEQYSKNDNKYSKLLDDTPESYYWLGLLVADGHFNKRKFITLDLSKKDLDHINRFRSFLGLEENDRTLISISDKKTYSRVVARFDIKSNKTYEPVDLGELKSDPNFFSFIIGFIDGDGSICKRGYLRIKCHSSWEENINIMLSHLIGEEYRGATITSDGLALGTITRIEVMKNIKRVCLELNLPILNRKWDRIQISKLSKRERSEKNKQTCHKLFEKKYSIEEVCKLSGLSKSQVYKQYNTYII